MTKLAGLLIPVLFFASLAAAQAGPESGYRLLPLEPRYVTDGGESPWVVEVFVHNRGNEPIWVTSTPQCLFSVAHACDAYLVANSTTRVSDVGLPYSFWWVTEGEPTSLSVSAFVRNVATGIDPWGTALPIPSVADFRLSSTTIGPVPISRLHRISMRAYTWPHRLPSVVIEFWQLDSVSLARTQLRATIEVPRSPRAESYPGGLHEVHAVDSLAGLADGTLVEVVVKVPADSPGTRVWAFASLTNNQTQHVTTFAP